MSAIVARVVGLAIAMAAFSFASASHELGSEAARSILLVAAGTLGIVLFAGCSVLDMLVPVCSRLPATDRLEGAARGWRIARAGAIAMGTVMAIIGLVVMLKDMDDPSEVFPGAGRSLVSTVVGFVLAFAVFQPLISLVDGSREQADPA